MEHRHPAFPAPFPRLHSLFVSSTFCDATVAVVDADGKEKDFKVHRIILASISAKMGEMFMLAEQKDRG